VSDTNRHYCRIYSHVYFNGNEVKKYISEAEKTKNEVGVRHGMIRTLDRMNNASFDTSGNETLFSGKGWAIFVVDMDGGCAAETTRKGHFITRRFS
ncbi:MAG: hypothetical protein JNL62_23575, partial [Bryobacterales bacterium]|nr:hypothetical protein [Bryobacterales bacterium]